VAKLKPHVVVGRDFRRSRDERGITQKTLAESASIDRSSLQRIEAGQWDMAVNYWEKV